LQGGMNAEHVSPSLVRVAAGVSWLQMTISTSIVKRE
jgi:hypothetical protein